MTAPLARPPCCVLIPGYHEEGRIGAVVKEVLQHGCTVLVVDDGSSDRTSEEAKSAGATVLRHEQNRGKGAALETGFEFAKTHGFDVVITMDADGQHAPGDIPAFLDTYQRTKTPVLVGTRMDDTSAMPWVRKMTNRFMSSLLSRLMGQRVPDTQCGYRLYAVDVLPHIRTESKGFAAESEQLLYLAERGLDIGSVPIATIYGDEKSKINPVTDTFLFFGMLWRYRRSRRTARD